MSSLWQHLADLFLTCPKMPSTSSPSVPRVDWEKVNKRFISNIPEPSPKPLQGCSEDPEFYEHKTGRRCQPSGAVTWEIQWSKHKSSKTPFGTKPGYLTDAGVISPDSNSFQVIHGYTWSPSCAQFVLHAEFQESKGPKRKKRKKMVPRWYIPVTYLCTMSLIISSASAVNILCHFLSEIQIYLIHSPINNVLIIV